MLHIIMVIKIAGMERMGKRGRTQTCESTKSTPAKKSTSAKSTEATKAAEPVRIAESIWISPWLIVCEGCVGWRTASGTSLIPTVVIFVAAA
jgi:hypothetical protein